MEKTMEKSGGDLVQKRSDKKFAAGFLVGVLLGSLTLITLLAILFLFFLYGGSPEIVKEVGRYEEMLNKSGNYHIKTGYVVFPEHICCDADAAEFYYSFQDTWDAPTMQVYLKCRYDDAEYRQELQRIASLTKLKFEEAGRFLYPAYVAVDCAGHSYEYALVGGDNEIIYVFTSYTYEQKIQFDHEYLPDDYDKIFKQDYQDFMNEEHTIYLKKTEYGPAGEVEAWIFDYDIDGK